MNLLALGLATWRVSFFLVKEDGPGLIARRVRELTGIEHDMDGNVISYNDVTPLSCVFCTSVWVAAVLALLPAGVHTWLAASALAVILEQDRLRGTR